MSTEASEYGVVDLYRYVLYFQHSYISKNNASMICKQTGSMHVYGEGGRGKKYAWEWRRNGEEGDVPVHI